jgi:hypothetical protein
LEAHGAAQVTDWAFGVLGDGLDVNVVDVGGVGMKGADFDVRVGTGGILLDGSG